MEYVKFVFKSFSKNLNFSNSNARTHAILGTRLDAPLLADEEEILFACGCFWGAEKCFWKLPGIITTAVGYAGGNKSDPKYSQVCAGNTGHTEAVRITWNKSKIDLSDLLKMFWECHDPTQGNRQGNDIGDQYRSAIYTNNTKQLEIANSSASAYQKKLNDKGYSAITTEIKSNQKFYYAEDYHQQYLAKPGNRPYCSAMPTNISLGDFPGANYKLEEKVWSQFNWAEKHCVLRTTNLPIKQ